MADFANYVLWEQMRGLQSAQFDGFLITMSISTRSGHTPRGRIGMIVKLYLYLLRYLLTTRRSIG
ncbi:MAG: hypothetical protein CMM01_20920 [Rhodopirellula sp.]|nr:hypothetical protein [Rhodopirellula sp.]